MGDAYGVTVSFYIGVGLTLLWVLAASHFLWVKWGDKNRQLAALLIALVVFCGIFIMVYVYNDIEAKTPKLEVSIVNSRTAPMSSFSVPALARPSLTTVRLHMGEGFKSSATITDLRAVFSFRNGIVNIKSHPYMREIRDGIFPEGVGSLMEGPPEIYEVKPDGSKSHIFGEIPDAHLMEQFSFNINSLVINDKEETSNQATLTVAKWPAGANFSSEIILDTSRPPTSKVVGKYTVTYSYEIRGNTYSGALEGNIP